MRRFGMVWMAVLVNIVLSTFAMAYETEIRRLSGETAETIAEKGKQRIAVVDFTDLQGNVTELGRFIAEEFSVALLGSSDKFQIVDRTHLKSLIKEHKLSESGLIDPKTARKLGEIAGVDSLITGTITPFGENIRISVKVLDVGTAMLIAARNGNIAATEAIKILLARGISGSESGGPPLETGESIAAPGNNPALEPISGRLVSVFQGTNTEGWEVEAGKVMNPGNGGNGGGLENGCLVSIDATSGTGYFIASSKFHGNWSGYKRLKFDLWYSGGTFFNEHKGIEYYDVIIKSGFATALFRFPEKPSSTWKTVIIPLDKDDGWTFLDGSRKLSDVLVNVTEFKIRAEYGIGEDKSGLDNVELVR